LFGEGYDQEYQGRYHVRGILCDKWILNKEYHWNEKKFNITLHWYFSAEGWKMLDTDADRVPVRCEMYGTYLKGDKDNSHSDDEDDTENLLSHHTDPKTGLTHFHHVYDIIHFSKEEPEDWVFDPTIHTKGCEKYGEDDDDDDDDDDDHDDKHKHKHKHYKIRKGLGGGAVAGISIVVGVFGIVLGMLAGWLLLRRRAERRAQAGIHM